MPFTHHSHSGEFCNHATNTLEEVFNTAVLKRKFSVFAMTEHIPRLDVHAYPGEADAGYTMQKQEETFNAYVHEARRLRDDYYAKNMDKGSRCEVLIGLEGEWIERQYSERMVHRLMHEHQLDYFIGSIHHVKTIGIDYSREMYEKAMVACGGTEESLFIAYFDEQLEMLQALRPRVIGHFDLIRLLSTEPDRHWKSWGDDLWKKIRRNLHYARDIGAFLEINTSALRKGLAEPYPRSEICKEWIAVGGDFVLSDDSHGINHLATCYPRALQFMKHIELKQLAYLCKEDDRLTHQTIAMGDLEKHAFWLEAETGASKPSAFSAQ